MKKKALILLKSGQTLQTEKYGGVKLILCDNLYAFYDNSEDKRCIFLVEKFELSHVEFIEE
jgi:hypothetical protein